MHTVTKTLAEFKMRVKTSVLALCKKLVSLSSKYLYKSPARYVGTPVGLVRIDDNVLMLNNPSNNKLLVQLPFVVIEDPDLSFEGTTSLKRINLTIKWYNGKRLVILSTGYANEEHYIQYWDTDNTLINSYHGRLQYIS